jgi:hypothetical protein
MRADIATNAPAAAVFGVENLSTAPRKVLWIASHARRKNFRSVALILTEFG